MEDSSSWRTFEFINRGMTVNKFSSIANQAVSQFGALKIINVLINKKKVNIQA